MHSRRMRGRLVALLGLPATLPLACAAKPEADSPALTDGPPVVDVVPVAASEEDLQPSTDEPAKQPDRLFAQCPVDHYRDWLCARTAEPAKAANKTNPYATCAPSSDGLAATSRIPMGPAASPSMPLDANLTQAHRTHAAERDDRAAQAPLCCYSKCRLADVRDDPDQMPHGYMGLVRCITAMDRTSKPAERNESCPAAVAFDLGPDGRHAARFAPAATDSVNANVEANDRLPPNNLCCYQSIRKRPSGSPQLRLGRALRHHGVPTTAAACETTAWLDETTASVDGLAPDERREHAEQWLAAAGTEHASVASFAKVALQLMALGAPPELVADSHRAAIDEVAHARASYALASRYAGRPLGPGPLHVGDAPVATFEALAVDTFVDGCVGETIAALAAFAAAETATDPAIAKLQRTIADQEQRHAELGWRIVGWCLECKPELAPLIGRALRGLDDFGEKIRAEAIKDVVIPVSYALLERTAAARPLDSPQGRL